MYSFAMLVSIQLINGTGRDGSLTNSSKPDCCFDLSAIPGSPNNRPLAASSNACGLAAAGGQRSNDFQTFEPVWNIQALGCSGLPIFLRWCSKKGSSIF